MEVETLSSKLKGKRPPVQIIQHKSRKRISKIQKTNYLKSDTLNSKADEKMLKQKKIKKNFLNCLKQW
ncbi:unnamed protein product [Macrosiphum euphorbiae]|uniref:Uncharacterized protein n=1 Tax=Macrosiphum euphorbiae TaxID=13131 RepID=A0AAV0X1D0_9HEMI|nr:unnamed protein product [Macrosiphum euphorbiae]